MLLICYCNWSLLLIVSLLVGSGSASSSSEQEQVLPVDNGDEIDEISGQLQIDFMSNLYAELTASSTAPTDSPYNETVVTVRASAGEGASFCPKRAGTPTNNVTESAILLDFRTIVFKTRHFSSIEKVAIYVVDKSPDLIIQDNEPASSSSSAFTVTVDASDASSDKNKFKMSANVAIGGKSVFLLPNSTGAVCVYFPTKRRVSLGIFGVIWGKEDASSDGDDPDKVEQALLSKLARRVRRSILITSNDQKKPPVHPAFYPMNATGYVHPQKKVDHPRFFLKERWQKNAVGNKPGGKKRKNDPNKRKHPKKGGKFAGMRKLKQVEKKLGVTDFPPFGHDETDLENIKRRRSLKNERRRRRRQNHQNHHHSLKVATAEAVMLPQQKQQQQQNVASQMTDEPNLNDGSCQRYKLPVKLSELGWKRVIIAPEVVDISYCSGVCSAANTPSQMTNQAMLLQLFKVVRGVSLPKSLPDPQCVPSAYSSLTLLFYDENDNIVLKNYPNMIATACGCR